MDLRYDAAKDFRFGVAVVGGHYSFLLIDTTGKPITEREFTYLDVCSNGLIRANRHGLCGFLDTKGNWVIQPEFLGVGMFVDVNKQQKRAVKLVFPLPVRLEENDYK